MEVTFSTELSSFFRKAIGILREEIHYMECICTKDEITFQGTTSSLISIARIRIPTSSSNIVHYQLEDNENGCQFHVTLSTMHMILKCGASTPMYISVPDCDEMHIIFGKEPRGDGMDNMEFSFPLTEVEEDRLGIPDVEEDHKYTFDRMGCLKMVKNLQQLKPGGIVCSFSPNQMVFQTKDSQIKASFSIPCTGVGTHVVSFHTPIFMWITKCMGIDVDCCCSLGPNLPLGFHFSFQGDCLLDAYLAPLVEDE